MVEDSGARGVSDSSAVVRGRPSLGALRRWAAPRESPWVSLLSGSPQPTGERPGSHTQAVSVSWARTITGVGRTSRPGRLGAVGLERGAVDLDCDPCDPHGPREPAPPRDTLAFWELP